MQQCDAHDRWAYFPSLCASCRDTENTFYSSRWAYFPSPYWDRVSKEAKSFLQSLLCLAPDQRASAESALRDPWHQPARPAASPWSTPSASAASAAISAAAGANSVTQALDTLVSPIKLTGDVAAAAAGGGLTDWRA